MTLCRRPERAKTALPVDGQFVFPTVSTVRFALRFATVIMVVLSMGLHWSVLQSVAWVGMIANFSQEVSLVQAVTMSFDGKHLCPLCKAIKQGRAAEQEERQNNLVRIRFEWDVGLIWQRPSFEFLYVPESVFFPSYAATARSDGPPKPPPRTA